MTILAVCLVVGALLAVVVGQAFLANGQVRLSAFERELSLEQATHRQRELSVAQLETPARIVGAATTQDHMVGAAVTELPYVSLTVPLPTPTVTPAPAPSPAPAATPASASAGTGATSTTATSTP
jgi:hypothetical protein